MLDNTARQFEEMPQQAPKPTPAPAAPKPAAQVQPHLHRHVAFSPFERLLSAVCGVIAVAFCMLYLTGQNQLGQTNRNYQNIQNQTAAQTQQISDYKQNIGELSNSQRLSDFAAAHGYKVIESNIKRVK